MPVEEETRRTLNMLRTSPEKAVRVADNLKTIRIVEPERVAQGSGVFWLYGTAELETGVELESVFVVDTGAAGTTDGLLKNYYWWIIDNWYPQGDLSGLKRLEIGEDEAFPFSWKTHIPLDGPVTSGRHHHTG